MLACGFFHVDCAVTLHRLYAFFVLEATDRILITGPRHLRAVLDEYAGHYNRHRPHRARDLRAPDSDDISVAAVTDPTTAEIRRRRVLGGLINEYERAA